jgi:hypothetical protein
MDNTEYDKAMSDAQGDTDDSAQNLVGLPGQPVRKENIDWKQLEQLLGLVPGQYTPEEVYARIERLLRSEQAETRLRQQLDIYIDKLALVLKTSKTPLSDLSAYLDSALYKEQLEANSYD